MENTATLTVKRPSYGAEFSDPTKPEAAVRVFVYVGTPSNNIGADGDFYLEEETNILYGPKVNGIWPEDGDKVSGPVMRRKRKEAQRPWSAKIRREKFSTRLRVFLSGLWGTLWYGWR